MRMSLIFFIVEIDLSMFCIYYTLNHSNIFWGGNEHERNV